MPLTAFLSRHIGKCGILLSGICVAYFYALDEVLFSSRSFSPIFRRLLSVYDRQTAWVALAACFLAAVCNRPAPMLKLAATLGRHPRLLAGVTTAATALGSMLVYRGYALSMDEYAAVFQSQIFAAGHLFAQFPRNLVDWLVVPGFNGSFLIASQETGRAIENYWPGFALLLAPFQWLSIPGLCNASLSGLAVFLVYWIARELTGSKAIGGWAMMFTVASGAFIADGISFYSMQAHLTANLLFVALLLRPTGGRCLSAGLVGSLALVLHNPVPHALFALPWILVMSVDRRQRRFLPHLAAGYLPGVILGFVWLMFRSGIAAAPGGVAAVDAVADGVFGWPDSASMNMRFAALIKMWIWALPCLFLLAVVGYRLHRQDRRVRLLAQSAALTFVGYCFVRFDQGHGWGYRYFHSAWGVIPILAACAMTDSWVIEQRRFAAFAGAAAILNLLIVVPLQLSQINGFITEHLAQLPPPRRPGNNIYFIHPRGGFYVADLVQMDPLLRTRDLYMVSRGSALDAKLVAQNWPDAAQIHGGPAADQWYLGAQDHRVALPGSNTRKAFAPAFDPLR